jgi:hypothetical protein
VWTWSRTVLQWFTYWTTWTISLHEGLNTLGTLSSVWKNEMYFSGRCFVAFIYITTLNTFLVYIVSIGANLSSWLHTVFIRHPEFLPWVMWNNGTTYIIVILILTQAKPLFMQFTLKSSAFICLLLLDSNKKPADCSLSHGEWKTNRQTICVITNRFTHF